MQRIASIAGGLVVLLAACALPDAEATASQDSAQTAGVWGTSGAGLNVRAQAKTSSTIVGSIRANETVEIACQTTGETVSGTSVWDYLPAYDGYASDAYLWTGYDGFAPGLPRCHDAGGGGGGGASARGPLLPLACGASAVITQGNNGAFSHVGEAQYGFDFGLASGSSLYAVEDGIVSLVRGDVQAGNPCFSGGGFECRNTVNYVVIAHSDGTDTAYLHINAPVVGAGQQVRRGDRVAISGGTGWSTGPHAHVQRQQRCGIWWCQSIAMRFGDVPGGGVPATGATVTSNNCP